MKKLTTLFLIAAIATPTFAAQTGPSKSALAAMTQEARETCAIAYLGFARAGKKGNEMSVKRDGRSPEEAKKYDRVGDAFELRGHQYLNAGAKISDSVPKNVDDAANASIARMLGDNDAFKANQDTILGCDFTADTQAIDYDAAMSGK
jgi:hypothetical protein